MLLYQVSECTKLIVEVKDKFEVRQSWYSTKNIPVSYHIINKLLNDTYYAVCKLISDFEEKAELFNNHIASECSLVMQVSY